MKITLKQKPITLCQATLQIDNRLKEVSSFLTITLTWSFFLVCITTVSIKHMYVTETSKGGKKT